VVERKGSWESAAIGVTLNIGEGGFYRKGRRKIGAIREILNVLGAMNRKVLREKQGTVGADV
jgi:hypothetical protein